MTNRCLIKVVFWTLGTLLLATSTALVIDIQPESFIEGTTGSADITCRLDANDVDTQTIITLGISKDHGRPLAYLQASGISYGGNSANTTKFLAVGSIEQEVGKSSFMLSILQPSKSDEGLYTCSMAYLDTNGLLKEREVSARFNVEILDIQKVVVSMRKEISDLKAQLENEVSMEISGLKNATQDLKEGFSGLSESMSFSSAFSAYLTSTNAVPSGDVFVFSNVVMLRGQGYNSSTGIYTAPRRGMYVFHLSMRSDNGVEGGASIMANNVEVARVHVRADSWGSEYQSSASTVIDLNPGDDVKVVASGKSRQWRNSKDSLFSGYLIKFNEQM